MPTTGADARQPPDGEPARAPLHRHHPETLARARRLTTPEALLWSQLRGRRLDGLKFVRQVPVGPFIADFICREARLVVEVDGRSHDGRGEYDAGRAAYLRTRGYRLLRVSNDDVLRDLDAAVRTIARECGRDVRFW